MKKITSILLTMLLILSMTACSSKKDTNSSDESQTEVSENVDTNDDSTEDSQEESDTEETEDTEKEDTESNEDVEISLETLMAAEESPVEDFEYRDNSEIVWITAYVGTSPIVVIPEEINGMPVTGISANAFDCIADSDASIIKAINLSNVTEIEKYAFCSNESIEIVVGNNVDTIGLSAFQNASNLSYISLSEDVVFIDNIAFSQNYELQELTVSGNPELNGAIAYFMSDDFVLIGDAGSTVEEYAAEYGLTFHAK